MALLVEGDEIQTIPRARNVASQKAPTTAQVARWSCHKICGSESSEPWPVLPGSKTLAFGFGVQPCSIEAESAPRRQPHVQNRGCLSPALRPASCPSIKPATLASAISALRSAARTSALAAKSLHTRMHTTTPRRQQSLRIHSVSLKPFASSAGSSAARAGLGRHTNQLSRPAQI